MSKAKSVLSLVKGQDQYIKAMPLEDGRLSFAVDSKKIYLDCDFEDLHGATYKDRISFGGGNSGIYYGVKTFSQEEIESSNFEFDFPDNFSGIDRDDIIHAPDESAWSDPDNEVLNGVDASAAPNIDDLILNTDGCFYRITDIEPIQSMRGDGRYRYISGYNLTTRKLTVAGSGGGGGGQTTGIIVAKDPNQNYNIIAANRKIPIGFKVTDSLPGTTIDVEVTINNVKAGTYRNVTQGEYTSIDLYRYINYFTINNANTVRLRFTNEYEHAAVLTYSDSIYIIELEAKLPSNLGVVHTDNVNIDIKPYGGSAMAKRWINVSVNVPGFLNPDVAKVEFSSTIDNGETYVYTVDVSKYNNIEGNYSVDVWISALANDYDTEELTSPIVTTSFIYRSTDSTAPMLSASIGQSLFEQYETATIEYMVAYDNVNVPMHLIAYCDDEQVIEQYASVSCNISHTWNVMLSKAGTWRFEVKIEEYGLTQNVGPITVSNLGEELPEIDTTDNSLQLYLKADGRSNNETNPAEWSYKRTNCTFENFNWNTNGWITDENYTTSLHLTNGAKLTVPFAIFGDDNTPRGAAKTGKTIEINFKLSNVRNADAIVINAASWSNDQVYVGIVGTGDKICMNTENLKNYHTAEVEANLTDDERAATNGLRAYLAEDIRAHIAFSISPFATDANGVKYGLIYTYVNGVLSGITQYSESDMILDINNNSPSILRFDSTNADIDIYSIRVYGKYCQDSILLNNYAADLPTVEQKIFVKNNNDVLNNGEISLNKVQALGNIPYLVVTDLRSTGDKKGNILDADGNKTGQVGPTGTATGLPTSKKTFQWAPCYYVDPEDAKHLDDTNYIPRSFGDPNNLIEAVIYGQGTSSMAYPVKNFRLRFRKMKYSLKPSVPIDTSLTEERQKIEEAKWTSLPAVSLFTMKADYMDSSMAHNTGTGNVLAALYDSVNLKTPAQIYYEGKTICSNVVGRPIIAFWRKGEIGTEEYIGRYNFNTDKAEHDLFGFKEDGDDPEHCFGRLTETVNGQKRFKWGFQSTLDESNSWDDDSDDPKNPKNKTYYTKPIHEDQYIWTGNSASDMKSALKNAPLYEYVEGPRTIQCWEFLNNASALDGFRTNWIEDEHPDHRSKTSWVTSFESRYPEHQETKSDDDPSKKYQYCSDFRAFSRLVNWINSTDQSKVPADEESAAELPTPEIYNNVTYRYDTKARRLAKFVAELPNYMDKNFTIFYYVITEVLLMIDSRGKNMMMCSYDLDVDGGTGHWFPIFYDMDTILGVDNSGVLRYNYDVDDENELLIYNASANYGHYDENNNWISNPNYSVLWCNLREGFGTDISTMYNNLRMNGKLSVEYLTRSYNDSQADAWSEIYDNKDGQYKYIRPLTEKNKVTIDGQEREQTSNWIHAEQGTRSMHRKYFLTHRLALLDSKYSRGVNEDIYLRTNAASDVNVHPHPASLQFTLTSQSTQYGATRFGGNGELVITKLPANTPVQTRIPAAVDSSADLETYIYNLGDIYDIGDLSDKFLRQITFNNKTKLRRLQLGNEDESYKSSKSITIGGLDNLPLLEYLDIRHASMANTTLNLSSCPYFRDLEATGSNITAVNFALGSNLQHVTLPSSITTLTFKDALFYNTKDNHDNLIIEDYKNIKSVNISGSPLIDSQYIIETIMNQDEYYGVEGKDIQLSHIRLPDINWTVNVINDVTCVLRNDGTEEEPVYVINDVKILDYIDHVLSGYDSNNEVVRQNATGNEYFGGTITINNNDYSVNDLALKNKYGQKYPNLKIVYTNEDKVIAGYEIIVHNAQTGDTVYKTDSKRNSITIDSDEAIGFNLKAYLENDVTIPAIPDETQWTYEFKGWSLTEITKSSDESVVNAALAEGITMTYDTNSGQYIADNKCPTNLTANDYTDYKLDLYPIMQMHLRIYKITFMESPEGESPEKVHKIVEFPYGSAITLPDDLPARIDLDPDNDGDKSKATIQLLSTYRANNTDYTKLAVQQNITLYPVYTLEKRMNALTSNEIPISYFRTQAPTFTNPNTIIAGGDKFIDEDGFSHDLSEGVEAIIKAETTAPAVCVPRKINGKYVVSIKNESPNIKRVFFEPGSVIRYINGPSGFNGSWYSKFGGGTTKYRRTEPITGYTYSDDGGYYRYAQNEEGEFKQVFKGFVEDGVNTTLEFIDLKVLTQLEYLGCTDDKNQGNDNDQRVFAYAPNLYIDELPDSLRFISNYTFAYDENLDFISLPIKILVFGTACFTHCTGLKTIYFEPVYDGDNDTREAIAAINMMFEASNNDTKMWPAIGDNAFEYCTNLNFVKYNTIDPSNPIHCTFDGVRTIGKNAFFQDTNFVWDLSVGDAPDGGQYYNNSVITIGADAFNGCTSLAGSYITILPPTLKYLGNNAFANIGQLTLTALPKSIRKMGSAIFGGDQLAIHNVNNLTWSMPSTLVNNKGIVEVADDAFANTTINTLSIAFESAEFENQTVALEFCNNAANYNPWTQAAENAYGARQTDGTTTDVQFILE